MTFSEEQVLELEALIRKVVRCMIQEGEVAQQEDFED
jgi:hypothetical protein